MAAIAPITIDDGKATPESHTLNPVASNPAHYRETGDGTTPAVGEMELWASLRRANSSTALNKAKITFRLPVLEVTTTSSASGYVAPPQVAYFLQATLEVLLPDRSTGDQRKDMRVLLQNALGNTQVVDMIDDLEVPY